MASWASGIRGVGPGVKSLVFRIVESYYKQELELTPVWQVLKRRALLENLPTDSLDLVLNSSL